MDLHKADLLACRNKVVDDFLDRLADGAHRDDDLVRIRRAVVVERLVVRADLLVDLVHVLDNGLRDRVVVLVAGLTCLEEDVAVLRLAAEDRVLRIQRMSSERVDRVPVEHFAEILIIPDFDLLNLVRGAEAVEEVEERDLALDCGEVRNRAEVHDLLRAVGAQHRVAGLAACINIRVVAENVQGMGRNAARGNVDNARQQLAGHLVHVRDHQEQALRRRVGGRQRTGSKRAVHGARRTGFRLHFRDADFTAEKILSAGSRVLIGLVSHDRRRRDRIDGGNVCERIGNMRGSGVAIHGFHFLAI